MGLGVLTALATTGAAGFLSDDAPRNSAGPQAAPQRGDSFEVTVHTVSDVDLFEGMEPATGLSFHGRVAGVVRSAECWLAESRAAAQNLLVGKSVRLTVRKGGVSTDDRIAVDVRLPDGADYAQTVVGDGVVTADLSARDELAPVESAAREQRRGLWASGCAPGATTTSSAPSSSSSSPAPTTTTTTTPAPETSEPLPPEPSVPDTPPTHDTTWTGIPLGRTCFEEGARKKAPNGDEMVCARNGKNQLRWRRAD
jgi:hypothetical protein